jgi:hypothetical protein
MECTVTKAVQSTCTTLEGMCCSGWRGRKQRMHAEKEEQQEEKDGEDQEDAAVRHEG